MSNFDTYDHLSPAYCAFVAFLSSISLPLSVLGVLSHPGWKATMEEEMSALQQNDTWKLVSFPKGVHSLVWISFEVNFQTEPT